MKTRLLKEIRLLLPMWGLLLVIAILPLVFVALHYPVLSHFAVGAFLLCLAILTVSSFGTEFSQRTFSQFIAQPISRERLWWEKVGVLMAAVTSVMSVAFGVIKLTPGAGWEPEFIRELASFIVLGGLLAISGGLFTTLSLRQVLGPVCFTILLPCTVVGIGAVVTDKWFPDWAEPVCVTLIILYGGITFLLARRIFLQAEDCQWSGGEIDISLNRQWGAGRTTFTRALLRKELHLQQGSILCAGCLMLLAVFFAPIARFGNISPEVALSVFGVSIGILCAVMPILVGASAVALERNFGVYDAGQCLPVPRAQQLGLKLLTTLGLGLALGYVLPLLVGVVVWWAMGKWIFFASARDVLRFAEVTVGLTLVAFYASTLAATILQALLLTIGLLVLAGTAVGISVAAISYWIQNEWSIFDPYVGLMAMTALVLGAWVYWRQCLANYRGSENLATLRWHNLRVLGVPIVCLGLGITLVHYRVWEWITPIEPPHGPARIASTQAPRLTVVSANHISCLFPDGRLWMGQMRFAERVIRSAESTQTSTRYFQLEGLARSGMVDGSNWTAVVGTGIGFFGLQRDGTLWQLPSQTYGTQNRQDLPLQQIGTDHDWQQIGSGWAMCLLRKTDGTLWRLSPKSQPRQRPERQELLLSSVDEETNWTAVYSGQNPIAVKLDGSVWTWHYAPRSGSTNESRLERQVNQIDPAFAGGAFAAGEAGEFHLGIRRDGTMWARGEFPHGFAGPSSLDRRIIGPPAQVGGDTDWKTVANTWGQVIGLKQNGTLWKWDFRSMPADVEKYYAPKQVGNYAGWVAAEPVENGIVALAADGTLWAWGQVEDVPSLLAPTRKPLRLGNVFE